MILTDAPALLGVVRNRQELIAEVLSCLSFQLPNGHQCLIVLLLQFGEGRASRVYSVEPGNIELCHLNCTSAGTSTRNSS